MGTRPRGWVTSGEAYVLIQSHVDPLRGSVREGGTRGIARGNKKPFLSVACCGMVLNIVVLFFFARLVSSRLVSLPPEELFAVSVSVFAAVIIVLFASISTLPMELCIYLFRCPRGFCFAINYHYAATPQARIPEQLPPPLPMLAEGLSSIHPYHQKSRLFFERIGILNKVHLLVSWTELSSHFTGCCQCAICFHFNCGEFIAAGISSFGFMGGGGKGVGCSGDWLS